MFGIIFALGLVGNLLVILVVLADKKMRNATNILILSLAVADLLFLVFCLPFSAVHYATTTWPFSSVVCKFVNYTLYCSLYASVYNLVLMALARYVAVAHPMRSKRILRRRNAWLATAFIWSVILSGALDSAKITDLFVHNERGGRPAELQKEGMKRILKALMYKVDTKKWVVDKLLQDKLNLVILMDAGAGMNSYTPGGPPSPPVTHWNMATAAASRIVHELAATDKRLRDTNDVILLLTNGKFVSTDEGAVLDAVKTGQDSLNDVMVCDRGGRPYNPKPTNVQKSNNVVHMVYTIKHGMTTSMPLLARLADLNNMKLQAKDGNTDINVTSWQPEGYTAPVGPVGRLSVSQQTVRYGFSDTVAQFYDYFPRGAPGGLDRILAVSPRRDPKVGLLLTFAVPLYNGTAHLSSLYGVAAADTSMASLFDDVIHFKWGVHSYSFLVERERGLVLVHPKLEKPYRQTDDDPVFSTMEFMEPTFTPQQRDDILAANASVLSFETEVQPGRSTYKTGQDFSKVESVPASVLYSRLPETDYIFVLVMFDSERTLGLPDDQASLGPLGFPGTALYHHQLVFNQTVNGVCARAGDFRVQDKVTVKFSPDVFTEPELYMYSREPPSDVTNMAHFLTEEGPPPLTIRREALGNVLSDLRVISSQRFARVWQTSSVSGVAERFIGTPNGVFASYPGISLPNAFDDKEYGWYRESVARPGSLWVSLRRSLTTTDRTVDVSTTMASNDRTFGVTGATVSRRSFAGLFFNTVEDCLKEDYACHFLTDDGYLLEVLDMTLPQDSQRHLASVFPWLAKDLLRRAVMKPLWCTVLSKGRHRQAYTLEVTRSVSHEAHVQDACRQYLVQRVQGSNLLVLILAGRIKRGCSDKSPTEFCSVCTKGPPGAGLPQCPSCLANPGGSPPCQCPCKCHVDFNVCQDSFQHMDNATFPLTPCYEEPKMPSLSNAGSDRPSPAVPPCEQRCPAFETKAECESTTACKWRDDYPYPVCEVATTTTSTAAATGTSPAAPSTPSPTLSSSKVPPGVTSRVTSVTRNTDETDGGACAGSQCTVTEKQKGQDTSGKSLDGGAIAGIVVGVAIAVGVAGFAGYKLLRPRLFGRLKEMDVPEVQEPYNSVSYSSQDAYLQLTRTPVSPSDISPAAPASTEGSSPT
nr:hypothetical protein BaRGS_015616 [Batillaria attramentaria]